jgi:hypothetical protein
MRTLDTLELGDLENFLGALTTGISVRRLTATPEEQLRLDERYAHLVAATVIGFLPPYTDPDIDIWGAFRGALGSSSKACRDDAPEWERRPPGEAV